MKQFQGDSISEAKRAFREFPHDRLFLRDALSRADGNLFTDRWPNPTVWLLRNQQRHTSFIIGECPAAGFIPEVAASLQTDQWGPCLSLPSASWRQDLSNRFGELFHFGKPMITFQNLDPVRSQEAQKRSALSDEFKLVQLAVRHLEQIRPRGWADPKDFIARSIGFGIANRDDHIVSYALSNFPLDDAIEVAVETRPEYRCRGLAKIAASALLNFSINKGLAPQWTSWAGNPEACLLARKLGFRMNIHTHGHSSDQRLSSRLGIQPQTMPSNAWQMNPAWHSSPTVNSFQQRSIVTGQTGNKRNVLKHRGKLSRFEMQRNIATDADR